MRLFQQDRKRSDVEWISRDPGPESAPGVPRGDGTYSIPGYQFGTSLAIHGTSEDVIQALLSSRTMRFWMIGCGVKGPQPSPANIGSTYSVGLMTTNALLGGHRFHPSSSPDLVGTVVELTTRRLVRRYELPPGVLEDFDRRDAEREVVFDLVESGGVTQVTCLVTAPILAKWRRGLKTTGASYILDSYEGALAHALGLLQDLVESPPSDDARPPWLDRPPRDIPQAL
jgi:hypothetical protein